MKDGVYHVELVKISSIYLISIWKVTVYTSGSAAVGLIWLGLGLTQSNLQKPFIYHYGLSFIVCFRDN